MRAFLLSLILCASTSAFAATYFIEDVKGPADLGVNDSLKSLISTSVSNAGAQTSDSPQAADYVLRTDVLRLGQAYILTVTRVRNGATLNSSRQKANSIEELDDAADRAVRATILATTPKKDLRVGEVKPQEENQLRRRIRSHDSTYFGFGPATFNSMGTKPLSYDIALGYNWEVTPQAAIRILGDAVLAGTGKAYMGFGGLGLNYLFTDEASSPYVGGLLGFGFSGASSTPATSVGGFAANLGLGWLFFRTSSTQFDVFVGYTLIFANNTIGSPGAYGARIGILF